MEFNRTKNASKNILFGILLKIYQTIVPFIMRTAMLYLMGVEYLGLDGLFTSILSFLNLAELGVGSAMVYAMYKPIAENDNKSICALMNLYKIYYRVIGIIVLVAGIIICPFIPKLISGGIPGALNVYILYLLNLITTVISYWLFAYKSSLLQAYQRSDIISKITLLVNTLRYILQFIVLFVFKNYYYYLIVSLFSQILVNVFTAIISNKMFPSLKAKGDLDKTIKNKINSKIKDLFTAKIGAIIVDSVDTIVISAFLGLTVLGIYQNYFYILTAITGIINILLTSCMAGIGNSIVIDTKEKVFSDFKTFTFIIFWISGLATAMLMILYQPFMLIWVGKDNMFEFSAVICFCVYFFVKQINTLFNIYKDAAGIWHTDRFRPLITAITNLFLNLMMVSKFGVYGILLSTIISMLIVGMPWLIHNLFTSLFPKKYLKDYLKLILKYIIVISVLCVLCKLILSKLVFTGYMYLFVSATIVILVFNLLFGIVFFKTSEFKKLFLIIKRIVCK